jgi:hypothetical protein
MYNNGRIMAIDKPLRRRITAFAVPPNAKAG